MVPHMLFLALFLLLKAMPHLNSRKRAQLETPNSTVMMVLCVGKLLVVFVMVELVEYILQN
jgi:hypothetical protein